jgi:hypothetical protein
MTPAHEGSLRHLSLATLRWHLALLGISGIALSVASGWTTWDGMANFTHNPVLSFLITFGIQSVMLISAWMIGETFAEQKRAANAGNASGNSVGRRGWSAAGPDGEQPPQRGHGRTAVLWVVLLALGVAMFTDPVSAHLNRPLLIAALFAVLIGSVMVLRGLFHLFGYGHLIVPYERSAAAIFKNIPLWGMFLVCMGASVFFSFDSLFDKIYSSSDREAVSQSRLQNHVSGLLLDLRDRLHKERRARIAALLESPEWQSMQAAADAMIAEAGPLRDANAIRQAAVQKGRDLEASKNAADLSSARAELNAVDDLIEREKQDLEVTDRKLAKARADEREIDLALVEKRFQAERKAKEAASEAAGEGVTQLVGKGQTYRRLKADEAEMLSAADEIAARLVATRHLRTKLGEEQEEHSERLAKLQAKRSGIATRIARIRWQIEKTGEEPKNGPAVDADLQPALAELGVARTAFLNTPDRKNYSTLTRQCAHVADLLSSLGGGEGERRISGCEAMAGSAPLALVFDANTGLARFDAECGKSRDLTGLDADELYQTGQSCIQLSGLGSAAIAGFQSDLRTVAMRRDDRAHRFVVTWNAFFDTNPLAFVALFIAVSIDGLVFITGLFGANAEVSLRLFSGRRTARKTAAPDLADNALLDCALLPDATGSARLLIDSLAPASGRAAGGWAGEIDVSGLAAEKAERIRPVLNAACASNMAEKAGDSDRYLVKAELIGHLFNRLGWHRGVSAGTWVKSDPEEMLSVALGDDRRLITRHILEHALPLPPSTSYAYMIDIFDCPGPVRGRVASVLNSAIAGGTVSGDPDGERRYLLTAAFVSMMTRLAASEPYRAAPPERIALADDVSPRAVPEPLETEKGGDDAAPPHKSPGRAGPTSQFAGAPVEQQSPVGVVEPVSRLPEEQKSSKLINFPLDSKYRQKAGEKAGPTSPDGGNTRGSADDPASQSLQEPSAGLEEAVADLIGGTDILHQEVVEWMRSEIPGEYDEAWPLIERLCRGDPEFQAKLEKHRKSAGHMIDRFRRGVPAACRPSGWADGAETDDDPVYRLYLLRRFVIADARHWCETALSELETSAAFEPGSETIRSQLQLIDNVVAHLSPLDRAHGQEWSEIGLRARGLARQPVDFEAFSDLMP